MSQTLKINSAVVIGAGIAGIKAALELAERGHRVYLCDRKPYVGGALVQLDKWFPDGHCGMCKVLPVFGRDESSQYCLRRGLVHPLIEIVSGCEVTAVEGQAGAFSVVVRQAATGVRPERCIACGKCVAACPVEVDSEFNAGMEKRKAVFLGNPLAADKTYLIDAAHCTRCGACADACPVDAIDLTLAPAQRVLAAGAIILSTGFDEFDPRLASQYGYGRFPNVITSLELERMLSGSGPTGGRLLRPSDGKTPSSVAFLQCVGSRTLERNYCSSACCMYALKEACMIREQLPGCDVAIYYMDMRAYGKGFYRYYQDARSKGVRAVRCRVPRAMQNFRTHDITFTAPGASGRPEEVACDLLVLSVGQTPSTRFRQVAGLLGLEQNRWGFCSGSSFAPVAAGREGVFVCGSAAAPRDIAETLSETIAAAAAAASWLASPESESAAKQVPAQVDEQRAGVVICDCGSEISKAFDLEALADFCRDQKTVEQVTVCRGLCTPDTMQQIQAELERQQVTYVVAGGCAALAARVKRFGAVPVECINIRERLAWVHADDRKGALDKARALFAMSLVRMRHAPAGLPRQADVVPAAVVIGAGLAGLTAARAIAAKGYRVQLLEKSGQPGGHLMHIHATLQGDDVQGLAQQLAAAVEQSDLIQLRTDTALMALSGHAGAFSLIVRGADGAEDTLEAGAVIIATGSEEHATQEYLRGRHPNVITQRELEAGLAGGTVNAKALRSVTMIQCVGSMDDERPYCSRVCCAQALKNALTLKRQQPDMEVVVLYRELMSYGFMEQYYTEAREQGVLFARYAPDRKPDVTAADGALSVVADDLVLGGRLCLRPDLLVLSTGLVAGAGRELARLLDVAVDEDGFFQEAEAKFRPVDLLRDGMYVCGLAHSPRNISETIVQAEAAAGRACLLLERRQLASGSEVSTVSETWCSGCGLCVDACPFGARHLDAQSGRAVVVESLCQACGACVTICPNKASGMRGSTARTIMEELDKVI